MKLCGALASEGGEWKLWPGVSGSILWALAHSSWSQAPRPPGQGSHGGIVIYTHQVRSVACNVPDDFLFIPEYHQETVFFLSNTKILFSKIYKHIFFFDWVLTFVYFWGEWNLLEGTRVLILVIMECSPRRGVAWAWSRNVTSFGPAEICYLRCPVIWGLVTWSFPFH